jgi:hypothetical protein
MENLKHYFRNIQLRNKMLTPDLKKLQAQLEMAFESNIQEAGVINPGYFSYFTPILEEFKNAKVISTYHISEEQFSDSYSGKLVKVPVVDLFSSDRSSNHRIFVLPASLLRTFNIDNL